MALDTLGGALLDELVEPIDRRHDPRLLAMVLGAVHPRDRQWAALHGRRALGPRGSDRAHRFGLQFHKPV